jgi:V8-like Glu-specific endopeptidase
MPSTWFGSAIFGAVLLLAGCAAAPPAVPPTVPPPPAALPWTAAIGALHDLGNGQICTATLVRQDMVLTAAHCMSDAATPAAATQFEFLPNEGATPTFHALAVLGVQSIGSQVQQGLIDGAFAAADWALLRIEPAPASLKPIAVNSLRWAEVEARLAAGDHFFSGGYGAPGQLTLTPHADCLPIDAARVGQFLDDGLIASNCRVRPRDSGGPMVLVDITGRPHLIAVISGIGRPFSDHPLGIGVEAKSFIRYINGFNVSDSTDPDPQPMTAPALTGFVDAASSPSIDNWN